MAPGPPRDLDRELRARLELMTDDLIRSGLSPTEAGRQARLRWAASLAAWRAARVDPATALRGP